MRWKYCWERIGKEAVMTYFMELSQHSAGKTGRNFGLKIRIVFHNFVIIANVGKGNVVLVSGFWVGIC